jgi:type I restriction enzyme M protein
VELVEEVARLATMNLLLHGIGRAKGAELPITCADSLKMLAPETADVVLTNPPFGVKGSVLYARERGDVQKEHDLTVVRPDFWVATANKQLNFIQHVASLLKRGGRAAMVVPDNVLFEDGPAAIIRRRLLEQFDLHTVLRLPTGLFYASGVQANVLFFDRLAETCPRPSALLWVYDLRQGNRFSLKSNPLQRSDLDDFVSCYQRFNRRAEDPTSASGPAHPRWRAFAKKELLRSRSCTLDLTWSTELRRDAGGALARLDEISRLIAADLENALRQIARTSDDHTPPQPDP